MFYSITINLRGGMLNYSVCKIYEKRVRIKREREIQTDRLGERERRQVKKKNGGAVLYDLIHSNALEEAVESLPSRAEIFWLLLRKKTTWLLVSMKHSLTAQNALFFLRFKKEFLVFRQCFLLRIPVHKMLLSRFVSHGKLLTFRNSEVFWKSHKMVMAKSKHVTFNLKDSH